ncbi:nitroreductase family protein [Psychromonas algicola]|uniref:nitroreductase family protein n=1 Tax=Psychromonas algicola TaxID=2555642 RepID=UPI001067AE43|nr:nitroreductase [Psychromonas sp. RZ5]TEW51791.1 nitroreductase [Psychromonas sp. RZ5]
MSALDLIYQRSSCHVHEMEHPAPDNVKLKRILQAVMSAPDHGNIKPWHIVVVDTEHVPAMCESMCNAWLENAAHIEPGRIRRLTSYLKDAPMVVLVSANVVEPHAVSRRDQVLAAAAACQNILLAAEQEEVAAIWYSTDAAELPQVHELFGLTKQQEPVAFIMLGSKKEQIIKKRSDVAKHCYQWLGDKQLAPLFDK